MPFQGLVAVPYSFKGSRPARVVLPIQWCSAKDVFSVFCLDNPAPCFQVVGGKVQRLVKGLYQNWGPNNPPEIVYSSRKPMGLGGP